MLRRASARGFTLWAVTPAEEAEIHSGLFAGLENGTLRPVVGKELPLAEAARATNKSSSPERRKNRARTLAVQPDLLLAPDRGSCGPR